MTDLPKNVKIGAHVWQIKSDEAETQRLRDEGDYGQTQERDFTISVDGGKIRDRQAETLLHEVFHAIETTWLTPKDRSVEPVVKAHTAGFLQVLRDNPELVRFILGE